MGRNIRKWDIGFRTHLGLEHTARKIDNVDAEQVTELLCNYKKIIRNGI